MLLGFFLFRFFDVLKPWPIRWIDQKVKGGLGIMLDDALTLVTKIAGAESGDLYTLRMENAVFIKVAARNILTQLSGLSMLGMIEPRYMELLRAEIEEFRLFFIDWIDTFDKSKDIPDNWGLFNI